MPRLGKRAARHDQRTLRFQQYVRLDELPPIPAAVDHESRVESWPMDGNDQKGSCVLAAAEHAIRDWSTYADHLKQISEAQVVSLYDQLSPNDDGLEVLSTLNLWRRSGLWADQIEAYTALDLKDHDQCRAAIYLFGSVNIGMSLPDQHTFGPWTTVTGAPNPAKGHDVLLVSYNATGPVAVTWGSTLQLSWAWYDKYVDEAYAVLSKDWLTAAGYNPDGFDWPALQQDLAALTGGPVPIPQPPPEPPIPPLPTPPGCLPVVALLIVLLTVVCRAAYVWVTK